MVDRKVPESFEYRGIMYPGLARGCVDINMNEGWTAYPSDILIATYPRSGTTWMSQIVSHVLKKGSVEEVNKMGHIVARVPCIEMKPPGPNIKSPIEVLSERNTPRLLKTHLRYEFLKQKVEQDKMKVIMVMRNPKDTLVSCYHFYQAFPFTEGFDGTFHDFFKFSQSAKIFFGNIFEWYKDWYPHRNLANVLFIKYEDMVRNSAQVVKKIARFLDQDCDQSTIEKIVDSCSIDNCRKDPNMSIAATREGKVFDMHYRKGIIGDWKEHFNQEESDIIDSMCKEHLEPLGLFFDFD